LISVWGIDGLVNGLGKGTIETSKGLRLLQTGNVGFYIFIMVLGIIAVLLYSVFGLTKYKR
jgi:NADH-quinone oxidoreductase subunit L